MSQGSRRSKEVGATVRNAARHLPSDGRQMPSFQKKQRVLGFHGTGAGLELSLSHFGGRRSSRPTSIKYQPPEINGLLLVPQGWTMSSREAENILPGRAPLPAPLPMLSIALSADICPGQRGPCRLAHRLLRGHGKRRRGADWSVLQGGRNRSAVPRDPHSRRR